MENKIALLTTITTTFIKFFTKLGNKLSEEQVLKLIIDPIIERIWEFSFAPNELNEAGTYESEVKVDVGHDTVVYPDRMLICNNGKKLVIECKGTDERIEDWIGQLETSVTASGAAVGILWNGTELWLFLRGANVMETTPYKKINFINPSEEDLAFIINLFDPKHTINDAQMKRDQKVKREQEEARAIQLKFNNAYNTLVTTPTDEILNYLIRQAEGLKSVQKATTERYRQTALPIAQAEYKETLVAKEIVKFKQEQAKENKLEPYEFAGGAVGRSFLLTKNRTASFTDDGDACRSRLINAENGRTILWFIGTITEDGYAFKGIAFPNRKKGIGTTIQISDVLDIQTIYGDKLVGVYDHINEPDWESFYDETFGE